MPEMQQRGSLVSHSAVSLTSNSSEPTHGEPDTHGPQSLPPWIHTNDGGVSSGDAHTLPQAPDGTVPNSRHYKPPPTHYKPGRKWDHLRSASPPLLSAPIAEHQERWRDFMHAGPNYVEQQAQTRVVDQAWLDEHMPYLNQQWTEQEEAEAALEKAKETTGFSGLMYGGKWLISPERQERTVRLFSRLLLKNPYVPLAFRLTTLAFSAAALAIAANIRLNINHVNHDKDPSNQCSPRASMYMALCIGCVAIPYVGYVTWDEYMSKPLGLRSVPAKVLLLLCDLYFVVFSASNLSLAFDTLYDHRWACYDDTFAIIGGTGRQQITYDVPATCPNNIHICRKQKSLTAMLLISLLAWLTTFSISVMRVVEKLRPD
ncbi:hypothetical protein B0A54_12055 [Friedmanniomyces endolithicus]|uniref:Uncharacterized protein n=1 Tax=Friedmanniomyces endolithicus TaxID=329885 RepID=A0A4U0UKZ4_9PEZI|nr:hypothetical protein LTS09_013248 [Friedmanniomyces endolithicus]TKA35395.1 hypothetical protein B0A54_12055 [Friedmanniomyces endolithicus]